jgi:UDP-N-acetyl-D-mannosaminuronate dehydrogenase
MDEVDDIMKIGIIGHGEIGKAIEGVYAAQQIPVHIKDLERDDGLKGCDYLHICIPYSHRFVDIVEKYLLDLNPKVTIIHSTIAPGTVDKLTTYSSANYKIVHSPVRGVHPDLYEGVMTFDKIVAGNAAEEVYQHFISLGMSPRIYENSVTSEVAKLLSTTYYGVCIAFHDYARKVCEATGANYDQAMTEWNQEYNTGYAALGMGHVRRPVLYPPDGSIGGHCIVPNAEILKETLNSLLIQSILNLK